MNKRKANESGIHVVGYIEDELRRIVERNPAASNDHANRIFAETLLILLARTSGNSGGGTK